MIVMNRVVAYLGGHIRASAATANANANRIARLRTRAYNQVMAAKKNSLVANINKRKKAGKSRSKKRSTVSKDSYGEMKKGWPKSAKKKSAKKKTAKKKSGAKKKTAKKVRS